MAPAKTRQKNKSALKIESIGAKDAVDVFCGNYHSFYQNLKGNIYAWGLNQFGQLGIGTTVSPQPTPTLIKELNDEGVV
jgi:alpha-tubulin suppressor-like RCC1 family protein